jgi:lambda family phage portal protein
MSMFSRARRLMRKIWEAGPGPRARRLRAHGLSQHLGGRLLGDMPAVYLDPQAMLRGGLKEIRAKSRYQALLNPYARRAIRSLQINIVGARGVQMRGQIPLGGRSNPAAGRARAESAQQIAALLSRGRTGGELDAALDRLILAQTAIERDEERNQILEAKWRQFCKPDNFDLSGRYSFHQYELLIAGAFGSHGGAMVRIIRESATGNPNAEQLCFELLSTDQLDEDYSGGSDRPGHFWRMGVETNDRRGGRVTRYAVLRRHPGNMDPGDPRSMEPKHIFVDARDLIHIFIPEEIGQLREIPHLAPVLTTIHNLNEYEKSHWTRKRIANNILGFIEKKQPDDAPPNSSLVDEKSQATGEVLSNSSPGEWIELFPDEHPVPPQLGPDDNQYETVLKTMLRRFSTGFTASYSAISGDHSDANYSSMREEKLEIRDWYRVVQSIFIQQFHQRVFEEWVDAATLAGVLPVELFANYWNEPELYTAPRWQARTWSWVDPAKEMKAYKDAQEMGLQSTSDQMAELYGTDLEHTWAQIAYEIALRRRLGLSQSAASQPALAPQPEATPEGP